MNIYRKKSDELFKEIANFIDDTKNDDIDIIVTENVIEINYDDKVFIINKQVQIEEVWILSPISGPYHFRYNSDNKWVDKKENDPLNIIKKEISALVAN